MILRGYYAQDVNETNILHVLLYQTSRIFIVIHVTN